MYKQARKLARLTLEEAAFSIGIGVRTLCRYEAGEKHPPADVITGMIKAYHRFDLAEHYCKNVCPLGQVWKKLILKKKGGKVA